MSPQDCKVDATFGSPEKHGQERAVSGPAHYRHLLAHESVDECRRVRGLAVVGVLQDLTDLDDDERSQRTATQKGRAIGSPRVIYLCGLRVSAVRPPWARLDSNQ
jgi:hypothetical protein